MRLDLPMKIPGPWSTRVSPAKVALHRDDGWDDEPVVLTGGDPLKHMYIAELLRWMHVLGLPGRP